MLRFSFRSVAVAFAACLALGSISPVPARSAPEHHIFQTLDGGSATLAEYRGRIVVLNLWAVWCSPCLIEIPHLVALQDGLEADQATVIGLAIDSGSSSAILRFWRRRLEIEPNYPLWLGSAELARALFDARIYPTTLIFDRNGSLHQTLIGLQTEADLRAAIDSLP